MRSDVVTAVELVQAVRDGKATPAETVRRSLAAIEAGDAEIGAFQTVLGEAALAEAEALTGADAELPLAGVPVAVKDVVPVAGVVKRAGSVAAPTAPADRDHEVVRRLRAAGAVIVGTTRVPEACLWAATDGGGVITRNPRDGRYTAGGSSGGSAAAVAAGMVPLAHGTDGLGSVRIPASACGLVGVKPGPGVIPRELGAGDWFGMTEHGVLATTVADAALMLSVLAGRPRLANVTEPVDGLRIAVSATPPLPGIRVDREVIRATFAVGAALLAAGHRVERAEPPYPVRAGLAGTMRWLAAAADEAAELTGAPDRLQARTRRHAALGRQARRGVRESDARAMTALAHEFFAGHDVLVTPTLAARPLRAVAWSERSWAANVVASVSSSGGFAGTWNLAGCPAISVPGGTHPRYGVPIGVQLAGPPGSEALLLGVAASLERRP